jgi:hypothetical protein
MFGIKILSLIGLLFISQILSVSASGTCSFTTATTSNCEVGSCTDSSDFGYHKEGNYIMKVTGTSACTPVTVPGIYKTVDDKYYSVNYSTKQASEVDKVQGCTAGKVDTTDGKFCLDDTSKLEWGDGKKYMYVDAGTIFSESSSATIILKSSDETSIVKDETQIDTKGVYVDFNTKLIKDRNENFCSGTILNKLYTCTSGVCTEGNADVQGSDNPYMIKNANDDAYHLYLFTVGGDNKLTIVKRANDNGIYAYTNNNPSDITYGTKVTEFNEDTLPGNTYLYYCKESECTLTEGYIRHGKTSGSEKLAYCAGTTDSACTDINDTEKTCTQATEIGNVQLAEGTPKIFKLCVENSGTETLKDVSAGGDFVTKNNSNKYIKYNVSDSLIAKVVQENGYYLVGNDNTFIKTPGDVTIGTGGNLITCSDNDCTEKETPTGYFVDGSTNGLITCTSGAGNTCTLATSGITTGYYVNADGKLVSCSSNSCSIVNAVSNSFYINAGDATKLISCDAPDHCIVEDIALGLYKTETPETTIIKCESTTECESVTITNLSAVACSSGNNTGKLVADGKLCLDGTDGGIAKGFGGSGKWVVGYGEGGIFGSKISSGSYGIVDISNTKIVLSVTETTENYYCKNDSTLEVTNNPGSCTDGTTAIPVCSNDGVCSSSTECDLVNFSPACIDNGYNLKSNKVYYCDSERATGDKCQDVATIGYFVNYEAGNIKNAFKCPTASTCENYSVTLTECDAGNIGLLYKSGESGSEVAHLCLNMGKGADMTDANAGNYILAYHATNNLFELSSTEYAMVAITKNTVTLNTTYKENSTLKYVYTNADYKVLVRGKDVCVASSIIEFDYNTNNNGKCSLTSAD